MTGPRLRLWSWLGWVAVALMLAAVFALYLRVDFIVGLADQLWSCF